MSILFTKYLYYIPVLALLSLRLSAGDNFPVWDHADLFKQDLKSASLVTNLPNITDADHFIGLQLSASQIYSNSGSYQSMPGVRLSLYPNPGYNLWVQFAPWPGSQPNFSVGIGLQVEFTGTDLQRRKAIGVSWNSIFNDGYIQRDISIHGLYGLTYRKLNYGIMAVIDLQHLVVEDGKGVPDYDETILIAVPYINKLVSKVWRVSLMVPYNSTGPGIVLGSEFLIGKRK
ncbi:MAG: hypothetical protein K9M55_01580 [Candidatus Marinimicrobia bacterium]|nr:hypothetical protein [Candidatus Neomarinimicrobiota bacterium]MCF7921369.1 hypothetical protein [Candidatus Neomarinimicrobiota bacterium]